jgi:predicted Zn finger-like uncharacterized protein
MKVQCGQCPAKYAVSDERIQDKKVRIHCKRCGASIVVDGKVSPPLVTSTPARRSARPASGTPSQPPPPPVAEREPESRPSPRPVAHTIMGGLEAPAAERLQRPRSSPPPRPPRAPSAATPDPPRVGMPATNRGLTDPPPGADDTRWRVALTKQDLRWMTTEEIVDAYKAGAVKLETFVFRTGMPTWVTLLEVPEIAEAISGAADEGSPLSSLISLTSPSSLPPPRKNLAVDGAEEDGAADDGLADDDEDPELNETVPFALVAERANGAREAAASLAAQAALAPSPADPSTEALSPRDERPSGELSDALAHPLGSRREDEARASRPEPEPAPELSVGVPFAAAQQASGSNRWLWVVAVVVVLAAAAALLAPRLGVRLL